MKKDNILIWTRNKEKPKKVVLLSNGQMAESIINSLYGVNYEKY